MSKIDKTGKEILPKLEDENQFKQGNEYPDGVLNKQSKIDSVKKHLRKIDEKTNDQNNDEIEIQRDNLTTERVDELFQKYPLDNKN